MKINHLIQRLKLVKTQMHRHTYMCIHTKYAVI